MRLLGAIPTIPSAHITLGSKLWLVNGRNTQEMLNRAINYCELGLDWLIAKNYAKTIEIDGINTATGISIAINFVIDDNSIEEFNFKLWENGVVEVTEGL